MKTTKMVKPLFNFGEPAKASGKDKNKSFKYLSLPPFGDADRDGYFNVFDCKPLNPKKHGVPKGYEERMIPSYTESGRKSWKTLWSELEDPKTGNIMFVKEKDKSGGVWSDILKESLLERETMWERMEKNKYPSPFKGIAGKVHTVDLSSEVSPLIVHGQHALKQHLYHAYPEKQFFFDVKEPAKVTVIDKEGKSATTSVARVLTEPIEPMQDVEYQGKESKLRRREELQKEMEQLDLRKKVTQKSPWWIEELPKHMSSASKPVKLFISDDPLHIIRKSAWPKDSASNFAWESCETVEGPPEGDSDLFSERYLRDYGRHEMNVGPFRDIGTLHSVGYFYPHSATEEEIKKGKKVPSSRIMLRWITPEGTWDEPKYVGVSPRVYPLQAGSGEEKAHRYAVQEFMKKKNLWSPRAMTAEHPYGFLDTAYNDEETQEELASIDDEYNFELRDELERGGYYGIPTHYQGGFPIYSLAPDLYLRDYKAPSRGIPSLREAREKIAYGELSVPRSHLKILADHSTEFAKQVLVRKETPSIVASPLAMHPDIDVKQIASRYPNLSQQATKHLLEQPSMGIQRSLFTNPSLTKKERTKLFKEKPEVFEPSNMGDLHPRVGMEIYRTLDIPKRTQFAGQVQNPNVMLEIMHNGTEKEKIALLRSNATNEMIEYYLANKPLKSTINSMLQSKRALSENITDRIYRMYPQDDDILYTMMVHHNVSPNTQEKIISKSLKKDGILTRWFVQNIGLPGIKPEMYLRAVDTLSEPSFKLYLDRLAYNFGKIPDSKQEDLVKKLFGRVNKEDKHLFIDFIAMLSHNPNVKVENTIMDILQKEKKISKEHYSQLLRFLMNSTNSSTIEKLIKMYG